MKTIEVAIKLLEEMGDGWSPPVRVRYVDDPVPMLELQTVGLTSPETIEKAAKAIRDNRQHMSAYGIAEAVLRSVEEGTQ